MAATIDKAPINKMEMTVPSHSFFQLPSAHGSKMTRGGISSEVKYVSKIA